MKIILNSLSVKIDDYYYVLLQVEDDELIFSTRSRNEKINGDHFILVYRDKFRRLHKNYLSPNCHWFNKTFCIIKETSMSMNVFK